MNGFRGPSGPSPVTYNGLTFSTDTSEVVISGSTFNFGDSYSPTTLVIGSASLVLGPGGNFGLPTPVTFNGLTFSADASEAIISGTTHTFGSSDSALVTDGAT